MRKNKRRSPRRSLPQQYKSSRLDQQVPLDDLVSRGFDTPYPHVSSASLTVVVTFPRRHALLMRQQVGYPGSRAQAAHGEGKPGTNAFASASGKKRRNLLWEETSREKDFREQRCSIHSPATVMELGDSKGSGRVARLLLYYCRTLLPEV